MKAIVIFLDINEDWWKKCSTEEKQLEKSKCKNAKNLFEQGISQIQYKICRANSEICLLLINRDKTIFHDVNKISVDDAEAEEVKNLIKCINNEISEYIVSIHREEFRPNKKHNITGYTRGGSGPDRVRGDILINKLKEFFEQRKKESLLNLYEELKKNLETEEDIKKRIIHQLTLLLHRIAHLFLPMDIDLMGILEVLKESRVEDAASYFEEAFTVEENNPKKLKSPAEIIDEKLNKIENGQIFEGLNLDDTIKKEVINCIKKPKNNLEIENVKEQLNKKDFGKFKNEFGKYVEDPEQNPFHQWFCGMMEKLEKMKEEYLTKGCSRKCE